MGNEKAGTLLLVIILANFSTAILADGELEPRFYQSSCPQAEALIRVEVAKAVAQDFRTGAGLLRLFFHDCFVQGCDASILIDSTPGNTAEKDAPPNQSVHGFEVIDSAKAAVERACPGIVSCADILAFAARTSINQLGYRFWDISGGRRDGLTSLASNANAEIPSPFSNADTLIANFAAKGLSKEQMVILSGSHTIGRAHCGAFANRLYNFSSTADTDPSLDPTYAEQLKRQCPFNFDSNTLVNMDPVTPSIFDAQYYRNLKQKRGLFISDQTLYDSDSTRNLVEDQISFGFSNNFIEALETLGKVGILTGSQGTIRTNCRVA